MRITIENVLGIQDAELEMQPGQVLEVVGPNASGKTSIAACVQALLAQDVNPLGIGVAEARKAYLRDGVDEGQARLEDGDDEIVWRPKAQSLIAPTQGAPHARPEAVGMIDFTVRRAAKERATVLQSALLPEPHKVLAKRSASDWRGTFRRVTSTESYRWSSSAGGAQPKRSMRTAHAKPSGPGRRTPAETTG